MEEKKENGKVVVITLLVLMVLALGTYIFYDKVLRKEEVVDTSKEKEPEETNIEILETTSELVDGLIGKITHNLGCKDFRDIYLTDGVFKGENFSSEEVYVLALRNMYSEVAGNSLTGEGYKDFTAERLEQEIAKIVGKNYKFTHQSYTTCPGWEYDSTTKNYKAPEYSACGCSSGPGTITKTVKAIKNGNKIEIYQRVLFRDSATEKYYSDSKKTKEIKDLTMIGGMYGSVIDESDVSNISKGTLYKLVFEEENGEYIFISSSVSE